MVDEGTDVSNKELMSVCLRYIERAKLRVFEKFCGFYEIHNIASSTIVKAITDSLTRFKVCVTD